MASRLGSLPVLCALLSLLCASSHLQASIINIPKDYPTIQQGIDAAYRGDTVLVAPGVYYEQLLIQKRVTLASRYLTTGDASYIGKTTIDGGGGRNLTIWIKSGGSGTTVAGLTITHGLDGIKIQGMATIVDNHIIDNGDGIDYSAVSGGLCARNIIENSIAEAIDIDDKVSIVIEDNIMRNNGADGIEIQLQAYQDTTLTYVIRRNQIYGNRHDGIQLVENSGSSNRFFLIEHNLIYKNRTAGVGLMAWGNLFEKYEIAAIKDRVHIFNNTIADNNYGIVGGENVLTINNIIIDHENVGMRDVYGNSMAAYNLFSGNPVDFDHCKYDSKTIVRDAPDLDGDYQYRGHGPGVDQGVATFAWKGQTVLNIARDQYAGSAPDMGAFEYGEPDPPREPGVVLVPDDFATLQEALAASIDDDTILVAPGEYLGEMRITKKIILASHFFNTSDSSAIAQTIIDGDGAAAIVVDSSASGAKIVGFTIRNGIDGIRTSAIIEILHNRISQCEDGIDFEPGSGGLVAFNRIELNREEGIDLHRQLDVIVEDNVIRYNGTDGIQIRLNAAAQPLTYAIRRNQITANGQDGIQLIDEGGVAERVFFFEYNTIDSNAAAALGLVDSSATDENFEAASLDDRIYFFNNTLVANYYGVTGGDNLIALNNLIIATQMTAMKQVDGTSIISHSLLWNNGLDFDASNVDSSTILTVPPSITGEFYYTPGSIGIDGGTAFFVWQGDTVLNLPPDAYLGAAPDIGAFEYVPISSAPQANAAAPTDFFLLQNYPNPFNPVTVISYQLSAISDVELAIFNRLGQRVATLVDASQSAGSYRINWNGRDDRGRPVASGVYVYRLRAGDVVQTRRMLLVR